MRVGVVDSGIHAGFRQVGAVAGGVGLRLDGGRVVADDDFDDRIGHGTAVAATIRAAAPEAALYAIRIFRRRLATHPAVLLAGIEWALDEGLDVVNLSLGGLEPAEPAWRRLVARAARAGCVLVGAAPEGGVMRAPGSALFLVRPDPAAPPGRWRSAPESGVFLAPAVARPVPGLVPEAHPRGASFAVAWMTGVVAAARARRPDADPERLRRELEAEGRLALSEGRRRS